MINIILLFATIFFGDIIIPNKPTAYKLANKEECITESDIIKPSMNWHLISRITKKLGKFTILDAKVHNPSSDEPMSLDAEFFLIVDSNFISVAEKYNLLVAIYNNPKGLVVFKRIYITKKVKIKGKFKTMSLQTPCFSRELKTVEPKNIAPELKFNELQDGGQK